MDDRILKQLYEPFKLHERKGVGNKIFKYVPSEDIVDRMNKVFKGSWSTEVQEKEIIEDQILLCVRVSVTDPIESKMYWHDGYASHPIARYTSGPNNGKPVDIGNSFKSAMSKAIKTAVSKWGVALYLEGFDTEDAPSVFGGFDVGPGVPDSKPDVPTPAGPIGGPPTFNAPLKTEEKKSNIPNMPDLPSKSPSVPEPVTKGTSSMLSPPFDIPIGVVGVANKNSSAGQFANVENTEQSSNTGFAPTDGAEGEEFCTPVQQVAINTIMESNSLTFNELALRALKREGTLPVSPEKAHYTDAVTIIQYGNELSKI